MFDIEKLRQKGNDLSEVERVYVMGWNDALDAVITLIKERDNDRKEVPQSGELLQGNVPET